MNRKKAIIGCLLLSQVSACNAVLPEHEDNKALVLVESRAGHHLSAQRIDGKKVMDGRFFILEPGQHKLSVRLSYERGGQIGYSGWRHCLAEIAYANFRATEKYSIRAYAKGYTARVWLQNEQGERLVESQSVPCGPQY